MPTHNKIASFFWKLSGEDFIIIKEYASKKIKLYFTFIGILVFSILIVCFISALYLIQTVFNNIIIDIGVGMVWGYIVTNMYVLLLFTITPAILPTRQKAEMARFSISMILRILIVSILALITAQPICVLILRPDSYTLVGDINYLLSHDLYSILISLLILLIFLTPIFLKFHIRKIEEGMFYEINKKLNKEFVENKYNEFKEEYERILNELNNRYNQSIREKMEPYLMQLKKVNIKKFNEIKLKIDEGLDNKIIEKFEYWTDPPFRTKKQSYFSQEDFVKNMGL